MRNNREETNCLHIDTLQDFNQVKSKIFKVQKIADIRKVPKKF